MRRTFTANTIPGERFQIPETKDGKRARLVTIFGRLNEEGKKRVHYVFDLGTPDYVECVIDGEQPVPSIAGSVPAACWYEREIRDQFGIEFPGSPDSRPLLSHENWPAGFHPMLAPEVEGAPWPSPSERPSPNEYGFLKVDGAGIVEVPVGPVHAGIIEPGHFRFSVVGDTVLHLELRHFYTHKGTEKLFQGRPVMAGPMLAESVSGDNCFSHAVAYCQAVEAAFRVAVPPRAAALRLIGLECERLIAHVGDVGALCNDVGFSVAAARAAGLKEDLLQASAQWIDTRYWRGVTVPGGLRVDVSAAATADFARTVDETARRFAELAKVILGTPSVQNRFDLAGVLKRQVAGDLAVVGPVARASGIDIDVRRDHPYGGYSRGDLKVPFTHYGDVMARARIRIEEAAESTRLIQLALVSLPEGEIFTSFEPNQRVQGHSAVESPRGELFYWVEASDRLIMRCHIKSPSFQNWPALPFAVVGNVIADFPLINKSFNLSYSGCDR
jgi:Ni,Fe-hydrogenase III large subunit/Ni,Fe-hydrogenase III component G